MNNHIQDKLKEFEDMDLDHEGWGTTVADFLQKALEEIYKKGVQDGKAQRQERQARR